MFQPRTGTVPYLGTVDIVTPFILASSSPTCLNRFMGIFMFAFYILHPTHQYMFVVVAYLSVAPDPPPPPTLLAQNAAHLRPDS